MNEELRSNDWVKVADQPPVRIMTITQERVKTPGKGNFIEEALEGENQKKREDLLCFKIRVSSRNLSRLRSR